ncbi:hypothetical protein QTP88_004417 [Uroleucon formosanum]
MMREYDDQLLSEYFDVSFMDVVTALLDASERRYSTDYEPEVKDDGEEVFDGGINDFVVSMVSMVVIASEVILEMQPSGTSEPQRGQAAPQEIGNVDGVKTKDEKVDDTGMQPAKAETSAKSGGTADLDCKMSIVPAAKQHTDASPLGNLIEQFNRRTLKHFPLIGFLTWSTVDDQSPHGWIRPQNMIKEWRQAEFSRRQIE